MPGRRSAPISQALTLQYDKVIFILEPTEQAKAAIGKRVTVADYPDGRLAIRYNGVELAYRTFDKLRQVDQRAIADNKRLGPVLAMGPNVEVGRVGAISVTSASSRSAGVRSVDKRCGFEALVNRPPRSDISNWQND